MESRAGVREGQGKCTIAEVNQILDEISAQPHKDDKRKIFVRIVSQLSAREQFWLMRIICKDMKMGMRHESMLKLFHSRALDIYNTCSSIKRGTAPQRSCLLAPALL